MDAEAEIARSLMRAVGVKAFLEVPADRPDEFITVEQTGSSEGRVSRVSLAVQAWAKTRKRAREIAEAAAAAAYDLDELDNVFSPEVDSIYRFPDPDSRAARYQLGVVVRVCE